jgi:hypothetical protein
VLTHQAIFCRRFQRLLERSFSVNIGNTSRHGRHTSQQGRRTSKHSHLTAQQARYAAQQARQTFQHGRFVGKCTGVLDNQAAMLGKLAAINLKEMAAIELKSQ